MLSRAKKVLLSLAVGVTALASESARAGEAVNILILKEQGVGSAASAQQFVDKLMAVAARQNGWDSAVGKYHTRRSTAESWIATAKPHYGILSLGAFLGLRTKHGLEVIGKAEVAEAGGREYHVISSSQNSLAGCKGKTLATNHADDPRFIDRVVAGGAFTLADFQLVQTQRPMQTVKAVTKGEAACALIDDAQLASMKKVEGGTSLTSVWKSSKLPPMVVVAFPGASGAEKSAFKANLGQLCTGPGEQACKEVGIRSLKAGGGSEYASVVGDYGT